MRRDDVGSGCDSVVLMGIDNVDGGDASSFCRTFFQGCLAIRHIGLRGILQKLHAIQIGQAIQKNDVNFWLTVHKMSQNIGCQDGGQAGAEIDIVFQHKQQAFGIALLNEHAV